MVHHTTGGIRSAKSNVLPTANEANSGFAFDDDGDTGVFAHGGNAGNGSSVHVLVDGFEHLRVPNGWEDGVIVTGAFQMFGNDLRMGGFGHAALHIDVLANILDINYLGKFAGVSVGNGSLVIDERNLRLGVGTSTPLATLDVRGGLRSAKV